jgi:alkylation response protein AidB-like acyl-CoA dehydrogenase
VLAVAQVVAVGDAQGAGLGDVGVEQLAELGVLGIGIREADGGLGGDAFDTMIVMEALGRALVVEPYLSTVVSGAGLVSEAGSDAHPAAGPPAIVAGERRLAFAHAEPGARYEASYVETRAAKQASGWKLDGMKAVVLDGDSADALIVSARTAGDRADRAGISLFLVDPKARGVGVRGYGTQDAGRAADVLLEGVVVGDEARLGPAGEALGAIERALDRANAALCAEALGIIDALNEATLEYL